MADFDGQQPARRTFLRRTNRARISRRAMLKLAGSLAMSSLLAPLLTSCQGDAATPPTPETNTPQATPTPSPRTVRPTTPVATPEATLTPSPAPEEQVLTHGLYQRDPVSHDFNANLYCGGEPALWSGLLTLDSQFSVREGWAHAWWSDSDAGRWTFVLRENNSGWSNGDPVTAHDFVWSWQRLLSPETEAPHAWLLYDIVNAVEIHEGTLPPESLGVRALDDWTLEVDLIGQRVYFPAIVASIGTVPAHRPSVEAFGDSWTEPENLVSNGPFRLTQWEHGERIEIQRSQDHWGTDEISLDQVAAPIIEAEEQVNAYQASQIELARVGAADLARVRDDTSLVPQLSPVTEPAIWFLIPDAATFPFTDPAVRKAVSHAIDRERLVQITRGRLHAAHCLIPQNLPGHLTDREARALQQFDVDLAMDDLERSNTGPPAEWPTIPFVIPANDDLVREICEDIAAQLSENLAIRTEIVLQEPEQYRETIQNGGYGLAWASWDYHYADPNNGYHDAFSAEVANAFPLSWNDPGLEDLLSRGKHEQNEDIRHAIYQECERILQEQAAYIPIAFPVSHYLIRPSVQNFPKSRSGSLLPPRGLFTGMTSTVSIDPPIED